MFGSFINVTNNFSVFHSRLLAVTIFSNQEEWWMNVVYVGAMGPLAPGANYPLWPTLPLVTLVTLVTLVGAISCGNNKTHGQGVRSPVV